MSEALGPFPASLLSRADGRMRRCAERLPKASPQLASWLRLEAVGPPAACADLLLRMLSLEPAQRITASEALRRG